MITYRYYHDGRYAGVKMEQLICEVMDYLGYCAKRRYMHGDNERVLVFQRSSLAVFMGL